MDRINPTTGDFDHLTDRDFSLLLDLSESSTAFSRLSLSESSPAFSRLSLPESSSDFSPLNSDNSRLVLPEYPFYSQSSPLPHSQYHPSASPPTPLNQSLPSASPPLPFNQYYPSIAAAAAAAAAAAYRPQFVPRHTAAASDSAGPSSNRLHGISADMIQLLNKILLMGSRVYVAKFFPVVLNEVTNLILDRHDSCVLEMFVNACDEQQRAQLLAALTADVNILLLICHDKTGSTILATLIKSSHSGEQISRILHALRPCILNLAKEKTGSDILNCCLSHPDFDGSSYILQPIVRNWIQLAFDKYGVFIAKQVVDLATEDNAGHLFFEIADNALELAQHPSGNYLIQHLLDKRIRSVTIYIISKLRGHFANLSIQKYSSNVVENCLKNTKPDEYTIIIRELLSSPNILDIFVDSYGNYVMQSAVAVARGEVQRELLDAIRKNLPTLKQYGHYRRIIRKYENHRLF